MSDDRPGTAPPPRASQSVHVSAVDWWIAALLMAGPVICVLLTLVLLQRDQPQDALYCLLAGAGLLLVIGLFTVPCRYVIVSDSLTIRCGIFFTRVPLQQIRTIERSGSWLSGPALSVRRVKVATAARFYLLSPRRRDAFIEELSRAVEAASTA